MNFSLVRRAGHDFVIDQSCDHLSRCMKCGEVFEGPEIAAGNIKACARRPGPFTTTKPERRLVG